MKYSVAVFRIIFSFVHFSMYSVAVFYVACKVRTKRALAISRRALYRLQNAQYTRQPNMFILHTHHTDLRAVFQTTILYSICTSIGNLAVATHRLEDSLSIGIPSPSLHPPRDGCAPTTWICETS